MTLEERAFEVGTRTYGGIYTRAIIDEERTNLGHCPWCGAYSPIVAAFVIRETRSGPAGAYVYFCKDVDACKFREAVRGT